MSFFGLTDKGKIRKLNEDVFAVRALSSACLLAVCDGMGGANAGEIASEMACSTFMESVASSIGGDMSEETLCAAIRASVTIAGEAVYDDAENNPERDGMGTTLVAAAITEDGFAVIANIGDSRAYHLAGKSIRRVTRDHSVVEDMVARGDLTPEQARTHPRRNLITRALGTIRGESPDIFTLRLNFGEKLLLCSDGLSGVLRDEEIAEIIDGTESIEAAGEKLLSQTLKLGAPDNVTLIIYVNDIRRAD